MATFDVAKYMGRWYELVHYPSWFERNDDYNTTANYELNPDGSVCVINQTISRGREFESHGRAQRLGPSSFRVDFPPAEIAKLVQGGEFSEPMPSLMLDPTHPNYIVERVWTNCHDQYIFAVVTDPQRQSLYVLSRYQHPSRLAYSQIMDYVTTHFDRDRLVQVPHFD